MAEVIKTFAIDFSEMVKPRYSLKSEREIIKIIYIYILLLFIFIFFFWVITPRAGWDGGALAAACVWAGLE